MTLLVLGLLAIQACGDPAQPLAVWGRAGREPGEMIYPRALAKSPDGSFFVVDRAARVQHFDSQGKPLNLWQMAEWSQGKPVGLTVNRDGNLWVPDTHYHRVIVFTPDGKEIKRFGTQGSGPGEFDLPTDVVFDTQGNIYVSEALFRAGVHPRTPAARLDEAALRRLFKAVRAVLRLAIRHGGTTYLNFVNFWGQPGNFRRKLRVYQRTGEACGRCGASIAREAIGGRSSHYCPECQPAVGVRVRPGARPSGRGPRRA